MFSFMGSHAFCHRCLGDMILPAHDEKIEITDASDSQTWLDMVFHAPQSLFPQSGQNLQYRLAGAARKGIFDLCC